MAASSRLTAWSVDVANGRTGRRLFAEQHRPAPVDGMPLTAVMNGADQEPPGAAYGEASPTAGRKHDGKTALGIKAKLFLAFGGMAMLTVGAGAVAWYAFTDIDRSVTQITAKSVVGMAASLRLAEKSAEITATAPTLIASRNEE